MHSLLRTSVCSRAKWHTVTSRSISSTRIAQKESTHYEAKYAKKLQQRAKEQGRSLDALRAILKQEERQKLQRLKEEREQAATASSTKSSLVGSSASRISPISTRKDSSPVKPLSSILNLEKILETPHTREQISALWIAYHQSRSNGTSRGYVCAVMDISEYETMLDTALKYPTFVVPFPIENPPILNENGNSSAEQFPASIFYMMQWGFHGPPPVPTTSGDLFSRPEASSNPQTSTVLFTPLQEYKLRQAFSTPYLVLTNYTDLAQSHGIVLLHGELTPSGDVGTAAATRDRRFKLSQEEAQLLAVQLQRFYLWRRGEDVKDFNEKPAEFDWKRLLKPLA